MFYFVYELLDPEEPFYIGITNNPNARMYEHVTSRASSGWNRAKKIDEILARGLSPKMRFLEIIEESDAVKCREKAEEREAYWIKVYLERSIQLTNTQIPSQERGDKPARRRAKPTTMVEKFAMMHGRVLLASASDSQANEIA